MGSDKQGGEFSGVKEIEDMIDLFWDGSADVSETDNFRGLGAYGVVQQPYVGGFFADEEEEGVAGVLLSRFFLEEAKDHKSGVRLVSGRAGL